ncbi:hypothetical protein SNEBB_010287 [Seison nebaliae]|nr:hypothetical protein SNEBB_010287 [Seison nebaliae]
MTKMEKKPKLTSDRLKQQLSIAVNKEGDYWKRNDAKFRAVFQKVETYEEMKEIVAASNLCPLGKHEKITDLSQPSTNIFTSTNYPIGTSGYYLSNNHEKYEDRRMIMKGLRRKLKNDDLSSDDIHSILRCFSNEANFSNLSKHLGTDEKLFSFFDKLSKTRRFHLNVEMIDNDEKLESSKFQEFPKTLEQLKILNLIQ